MLMKCMTDDEGGSILFDRVSSIATTHKNTVYESGAEVHVFLNAESAIEVEPVRLYAVRKGMPPLAIESEFPVYALNSEGDTTERYRPKDVAGQNRNVSVG